MKRRIRIASATAALGFAVMFAGAANALGASGGCASGCAVGGDGTGGVNSGGAAQGFNDKNLTFPEHPGEVISNSGTDFSGHLVSVDATTGQTIISLSGAENPVTGEFVGHVTFGN